MTLAYLPLLVPEFDPQASAGEQMLDAQQAYIGRRIWLPKGVMARTCHRYRDGYVSIQIRKTRSVIVVAAGFDKHGLRLYWQEHGRRHYIDAHFVLLETPLAPLEIGSRLRTSLLAT